MIIRIEILTMPDRPLAVIENEFREGTSIADAIRTTAEIAVLDAERRAREATDPAST